MTAIESIIMFWSRVTTIFSGFRFVDLLDILLVALVLYNLIKLIRETRAFQLAKGFALLGIAYIIILTLKMQASAFIFQRLISDFIILIIILFQPEIRHALESVGGSSLSKVGSLGFRSSDTDLLEATKMSINEACRACTELSSSKTGAIIVFENKTPLGDHISTGTPIDAKTSKELIGNIFFPMSPLHDGAVIVKEGRVSAAGCILPLSQNGDISRELGTRHRAAIGLSEHSDAAIVVVSEETGHISLAYKGQLERKLSPSVVKERLLEILVSPNEADNLNGNFLKRIFGGLKK
ncbi:MAG: TIGR00159 family protein [Clostridiales bacterium]|nr:TIGR00159 family protein [Clostridiales bacterium]